MGGSGYLPGELYRQYLKTGRIRREHLDEVLRPLTQNARVMLGGRTITHGEVLRACLTEGLGAPGIEPLDSQLPDPSHSLVERLAAGLQPVLTYPDLRSRIHGIVESDEAALGRWLTLSHWCDETLGTEIVRQINDQLVKWCEAFLDEGHATWAMPERAASITSGIGWL